MPSRWDKRIARAAELETAHPAAAELLRFYRQITEFQRNLYAEMPRARLEDWFGRLLELVRRAGPPLLAGAADTAPWDEQQTDNFFVRAVLQPCREFQAARADIPRNQAQAACPFCGQKPVLAVLRGEGDGAKRSLLCSLCATEWEYRRILCPNCMEEDKDRLPVYAAAEFPHLRVEACDACRTYVKAVDLSRNGRAVPEVDELALQASRSAS
jgi:FdhE protein